MISIECSKRRKCPATKKLLGDATRKTVGHCEFSFELFYGTGTFSTPDGKIHQSMYFQIRADSEAERDQRLKCLRKRYGYELVKVFQNIPGQNPIIDWKISSEDIMRLSACVEQLHEFDEHIMELFNSERKLEPIKPNSDMLEVWSRFISHRFSLANSGLSAEDMNENAVGWTEEDIEDLGSEKNLAGLRYIAEGLKKDKDGETL